MRIKNKKTSLEYEVTPEEWELITARGDSRKYTILSHGAPLPADNPEVADYKALMRKADTAFKEERFHDAQSLYVEAQQIKDSKLIQKKLSELEKILSE